MESFYNEYDRYCMNLHECGFYVEWLSKDEFMNSIKTYGDLVNIHLKIGYIDDISDAFYLKNLKHK